jgi:hypothetical protein
MEFTASRDKLDFDNVLEMYMDMYCIREYTMLGSDASH